MQLRNKFYRGDKIVIASHNEGKINEFKTLLADYNLQIITSNDIGIKDVKETGKSFQFGFLKAGYKVIFRILLL